MEFDLVILMCPLDQDFIIVGQVKQGLILNTLCVTCCVSLRAAG